MALRTENLRLFDSENHAIFLLLLSFMCLLLCSTDAILQNVFFANESLTVIADRLREHGMEENEIIVHLKNTLTRVTKEYAEAHFGIQWLESVEHEYIALDMGEFGKYPDVVICDMGPVGLGLFTLNEVKEGNVIADYTGEYVCGEEHFYQEGEYRAATNEPLCVLDALNVGHAARFALHVPREETLDSVRYRFISNRKILTRKDMMVENSRLEILLTDNVITCMYLKAMENIPAFDMIGFQYSRWYGYEFSAWMFEPHIFDRKGRIIPRDVYTFADVMLLFDQPNGDIEIMPLNRMRKFNDYLQSNGFVNHVVALDVSGEIRFVLHSKQLKEALSRVTANQWFLAGYLVNDTVDIERFTDLFEKMCNFDFDSEEIRRVLTLAKKSRWKEASALFRSLKNKNVNLPHKDEL